MKLTAILTELRKVIISHYPGRYKYPETMITDFGLDSNIRNQDMIDVVEIARRQHVKKNLAQPMAKQIKFREFF